MNEINGTNDHPDQPRTEAAQQPGKRQQAIRAIAVTIFLALVVTLYFIWSPFLQGTDAQSTGATQQDFSTSKTSKATSTASANTTTTDALSVPAGGTIQAYIVGAVRNPGVYTLPANARIYQLLQKAGGPLPGANLVAINLAAKLTDGEEIYISRVGEQAPTNIGNTGDNTTNGSSSTSSSNGGAPVNINTASATELEQGLHISSKTATAIINYRVQHGPYTSVEQLVNVVSTSIYNKIKGLVTVE
jgi:competence protein ComEA